MPEWAARETPYFEYDFAVVIGNRECVFSRRGISLCGRAGDLMCLERLPRRKVSDGLGAQCDERASNVPLVEELTDVNAVVFASDENAGWTFNAEDRWWLNWKWRSARVVCCCRSKHEL